MRHWDSPRTRDSLSCTVAKPIGTPYVWNLITKGMTVKIHTVTFGLIQTTSLCGGRYLLVTMSREDRYIRVHLVKATDNIKR